MNIGDYLTYMLEKKGISRKTLYANIVKYYEQKNKEYVTYQRFCSKILEQNISGEELLLICYITGIDINRIMTFAKMEFGERKINKTESDKAIEFFRDYFNTYYEDEIVKINDDEVFKYLKKVNSKINPEKHEIISGTCLFNTNTENEEKQIDVIGYSIEENSIIFESINEDNSNLSSKEMFESYILDELLELENMTINDFVNLKDYEKFDFVANKIFVEYAFLSRDLSKEDVNN